MTPTCPYCGALAKLVTGKVIYPHRPDLRAKRFYLCASCDAWVGCHGSGKTPLGRLANAALRSAKRKAHAAFDSLWKTRRMKRGAAYAWLADAIGVPVKECHIGMFDESQCSRVVEVVRDYYSAASSAQTTKGQDA